MPQRIQHDFSKGMVTDIATGGDSLAIMEDCILYRGGEVAARGPVQQSTDTLNLPAGYYNAGVSDCAFHPNFGTAMVRGRRSALPAHLENAGLFQLVGFPLLDESIIDIDPGDPMPIPDPEIDYITKGTNGDKIRLDHGSQTLDMQLCQQHAILPNEIVFAGLLGDLFRWGGSFLPDWTAGTVSTTEGSRIITGNSGATTLWATNVEEGMYILIDGVGEKASNGEQRAFRITYVQDNDTLEVDYPMAATLAGKSYRIVSAAVVQAPPGVWNPDTDRPTTQGVVCYHQGRLFVAGTADAATDFSTVFNLDRIRWSANASDVMADPTNETGFHHTDLWRPNAYLDIAPGIGGAIRGLVSMGDDLIVIKTHAIFRVSGAVAMSGGASNVDVKISMIADGIGATGPKAFAMTKRGLLIASHDGLYLYDGQAVRSLLANRLQRWWDHYFNSVQTVMVAYPDKVIISEWRPSANDPGSGYRRNLVWCVEQDYFFSMRGSQMSCGVSLYSAGDRYINDVAYKTCNVEDDPNLVNGVFASYWFGGVLVEPVIDVSPSATDSTGFSTYSGPKPFLLTHPMALGEDALSEGRINTVFLNSMQNNTAAPMPVFVTNRQQAGPGLQKEYIADWIAAATQSHFRQLEYPLPELPTTTALIQTNRVARIPAADQQAAPFGRVAIGAPYADSAAQNFMLYAIGIDFITSKVQGPTS